MKTENIFQPKSQKNWYQQNLTEEYNHGSTPTVKYFLIVYDEKVYEGKKNKEKS